MGVVLATRERGVSAFALPYALPHCALKRNDVALPTAPDVQAIASTRRLDPAA